MQQHLLDARARGLVSPLRSRSALAALRVSGLALSVRLELVARHRGPVGAVAACASHLVGSAAARAFTSSSES